MRSTHTYSAVLIGAPDRALDVRGGRVTLDSTRAPHVTMSLEVAVPDESLLVALDPRLNKRVRVTMAAAFPTFSQTRVLNLHLREADQTQDAATVDLTLESDEALLDDYAPLADDVSIYASQASLRAVVNAVLGKAIPGAALAATPAQDAVATTSSDAINLAVNPRASVNTTQWGATGVSSLVRITGDPRYGTAVQANYAAATGATRIEHSGIPLTPGRTYYVEMGVRSSMTQASGPRLAMGIINSAGTPVRSPTEVPFAMSGSYASPRMTFVAPPDAAQGIARILLNSATAGAAVIVSGLMVREASPDPGDVGYWDGDTADTAAYQYDWSNTAGASSSIRTALVDRPAEALYWRAGTSALEFLHPIVQASGFRLVCNEARVWTLRPAGYVAPGEVTVVYAQDMVSGEGVLAREGEWFDAQVTRYTWEDVYGITRTVTDSWALVTPPTRVNLVEVEAPYPGPGRSQYAVRRAQGRGRAVTATKVADLSVVAEQGVSIYMLGAPTQTGLVDTVEYSLDDDEMTLTTRTADTRPGAVDLLTGVIDALAGVIDAL